MADWQPIDSAPHATDEFGLSGYVLLYLPDYGEKGEHWVTMGSYFREDVRDDRGRFKGGGWTGVDWDGLPSGDLNPSHWMPLPAPPTLSPAASVARPEATGINLSLTADAGEGLDSSE